jgi:hypothetical protein
LSPVNLPSTSLALPIILSFKPLSILLISGSFR